MPRYSTLEEPLDRTRKKNNSHQPDPEYISRLRQVLRKNSHNSFENHGEHQVYRSQPPIEESVDSENDSDIIYVVKEKPKKRRQVSEYIQLPKIKKGKSMTVKKEQIDRSDREVIRNYMNANLVVYRPRKSERFKTKKRKRRLYLTEQNNAEERYKSQENRKRYEVATPIYLIKQHTQQQSSRVYEKESARTDQLPKPFRSKNLDSLKLNDIHSSKVRPPQHFTSVIPQKNWQNSDREPSYLESSKDRINRSKSNEKHWSQINPLLLETYFVKLKRKIGSSPEGSKIEKKISKLAKIPAQADFSKFIRNYFPENQKIKIDELIKSQQFDIIHQQTSEQQQLYFGELSQNKPHGTGILMRDKIIFQGTWKNGVKVEGVEKTQVGTYKGQFKDGKREGKGEFFWAHGQYYSGEWKAGKKHGSGYWKSLKQQSYMGEWNNGQVNGYGVHTMKTGQRYEGEFKNFLKHGFGKQQFPNGDTYEGKYIQGHPYGTGKYKWKCGVIFEGQFCQGIRQGKGRITWQNRLMFEGVFKDDLPNGEGHIIEGNGDEFNGNFENGMKEGIGILNLGDERKIIKGKWSADHLINQI